MRIFLVYILGILSVISHSQESVKIENYFYNSASESLISNIENASAPANNNCDFYLKYPPILSSFLVTEEHSENVNLIVKEVYGRYDVELKLRIYDRNGYVFDDFFYEMFDDGTNGDSISGDFFYSNDNILIPYYETETFSLSTIVIFVNYLENNNVVHIDEVWMNLCHINKNYLNTLESPVVNYMDSSGTIIWSDNFISVNKIENWHELDKQQHGYGCCFDYSYIQSDSILYKYWEESQISDETDDYTYLQVDLIEPGGQYTYIDGNSMYLRLITFSIYNKIMKTYGHMT
jgi:hypothetical protein